MPATVALSPAQPEIVESSLDVNLGTGMLCDGSVTVMLCVLRKSKCTRAWPPREDASDPGRYPGKRCLAPAEHLSLCVQREATSGRADRRATHIATSPRYATNSFRALRPRPLARRIQQVLDFETSDVAKMVVRASLLSSQVGVAMQQAQALLDSSGNSPGPMSAS